MAGSGRLRRSPAPVDTVHVWEPEVEQDKIGALTPATSGNAP